MAFVDGVYKLSAVNLHGDLVALEVSALTGLVEFETIIANNEAPLAPPRLPVGTQPIPPPRSEPGRDPLVVY